MRCLEMKRGGEKRRKRVVEGRRRSETATDDKHAMFGVEYLSL